MTPPEYRELTGPTGAIGAKADDLKGRIPQIRIHGAHGMSENADMPLSSDRASAAEGAMHPLIRPFPHLTVP